MLNPFSLSLSLKDYPNIKASVKRHKRVKTKIIYKRTKASKPKSRVIVYPEKMSRISIERNDEGRVTNVKTL